MPAFATTVRARLTFLLALMLTATAWAGAAGQNTLTNPVRSSATAGKTTVVANRAMMMPGVYSNGTDVSYSTKVEYRAMVDCTDIRIQIANHTLPTDTPGPTKLLKRYALEYPAGTIYALTFDGQRDAWLTPRTLQMSDPIGILIPQNARFWVREYGTGVWGGMASGASDATHLADGIRTTFPTNAFAGWWLSILSGTGAGQTRLVTANTGSTFTVAAWTTTPDGTSIYCVTPPYLPVAQNPFQYVGTCTAAGTTTGLNDAAIATAGWQNFTGFEIIVLTGANAGTVRTVSGVASTGVAVGTAWGSAMAAGDTYALLGVKWPLNCYAVNSEADWYVLNSYDRTGDSSWSTTASQNVRFPTPIAVCGTPYVNGKADFSRPLVALVGDSIWGGAGENGTGLWQSLSYGGGDGGYAVRALEPLNICYRNWSITGQQLQTTVAATQHLVRGIASEDCTHAFIELGINDFNGGRSLAQMQADYLTLIESLKRHGITKIYGATLTPESYSTDSWATVANQVPFGYAVQTITNGTSTADPVRIRIVSANPASATVYGIAGDSLVDNGVTYWLSPVNYSGNQMTCSLYTDPARTVGALAGAFTVGDVVRCTGAMQRWTAFNQWMRSSYAAIGLVDYCDASKAACTALDSGIWNAGYGYDGIHPNPVGHAALALAMPLTGLSN